ncbi:MAG: YgiQ family radical SAM protein [Candidatus Sumerlaeia bacterium]
MTFIPTTPEEVARLGWSGLDAILVTGDGYIDSPFVGVAVIGHVLMKAGYRVGIIAQPETGSADDIARLGEPELFWGVTGGCIDSMVANYTAGGRKRKSDDYTPGGVNDRRPDRAAIVYSNLIRKHMKGGRPIVLGGLEASLRRVAHYDFWSDRIRRSILFDAKADYLLYGMAERSVVELAERLKAGQAPSDVRGLCYIAPRPPEGSEVLPSFAECAESKDAFTQAFHVFYRNNDPVSAKTLAQQQDTRYLVQNPPAEYLVGKELDAVYELPYERELHPFDRRRGDAKALETIRFSITTHQGCYGECNFCSISVHQGRRVRWRSEASILAEARAIAKHPMFKGTLHDVGGPTANMYGIECAVKAKSGACANKRCLFPGVCPKLDVDHARQTKLLAALRRIPGVRRVIVASGLRYDMILADERHGAGYLRQLLRHHIPGQMRIAPEHSEPDVLKKMGKPGRETALRFKSLFEKIRKEEGQKQFLTCYFIAAHPGCTEKDMRALKAFAERELHVRPEDVQLFTPTPGTYSSLMYWTQRDPFTGQPIYVEKTVGGRTQQKNILTAAESARIRRLQHQESITPRSLPPRKPRNR